jgi:oxygen-dependent protoporphyrinogen oxidase
MKRIVIIGGGISGLAAAHRLLECSQSLEQPLEIHLLEASPRLGGIIQTDTRDAFLLERGPDSFLAEKPEAINLAERLGIASRLIATNNTQRRSFIVRKGTLLPVPEGFHLLAPAKLWPFANTRVFSLRGKLRIAAELMLPRKANSETSDESLAHFVRRRFGTEALIRMAQPMVGGIYTADPEKLSLRASFPRFLEMEARYRSIILALLKTRQHQQLASGARYALFQSFELGMQTLTDALSERISNFTANNSELNASPVTFVHLKSRVKSLERLAPQWRIEIKDRAPLTADAICLAVPAPVSAMLLDRTASTLAGKLKAIPHAATATINLGYRREDIEHPLDGFGFVVPYVEKRSLLACTFSSVKFPGRAPVGSVLLRAFVGGALQPEIFSLTDAKIISLVCSDLRDLIRAKEPPIFAEVSKWPDSMPQYEVGHLQRVEEINRELAGLPSLKIAGNALHGVGIPDCIRSGEMAAEELIEGFRRSQ